MELSKELTYFPQDNQLTKSGANAHTNFCLFILFY